MAEPALATPPASDPRPVPLPENPRIIALANQKGGVGKTTTAVNLATALAANGERVLLVDLDPQGNASTGLGVPRGKRNRSAYELLLGHVDLREAVQPTSVPGLDIVPAAMNLVGAEVELVGETGREFRLREALRGRLTGHGHVLIDCPPSLSLLTVNGLVAADAVMVPLQAEFFALEGLSHLVQTIDRVRKAFNPQLEIEGVVLTMVDSRTNLSSDVAAEARRHFGKHLYQTVIPRNIRIAEAPSHGVPVLVYDHRSAGALAYAELARELLARESARRSDAAPSTAPRKPA